MARVRDAARSRCSVRTTTVSASRVTRRCWWVFVAFSTSSVPYCAMARRYVSTPPSRSTWFQHRAQISLRRPPVVIVSQTSAPQSGSRHASSRIRTASAAVGGCGSGFRAAGGEASATGLNETQRQRTAFSKAPFSTKWMCRTVAGASGEQTCGRQRSSQTCSRGVRWSMRPFVRQWIRHRRSSA
jgi:hypothetical protein